MKVKINNSNIDRVLITEENIYDVLRLLTLAQIENVLKSECNYVLIYIGDEINFIYCDPIPVENLAISASKRTGGFYTSKDVFKENIKPRLIGL
jgi:site-specific DNA-adenine methylase